MEVRYNVMIRTDQISSPARQCLDMLRDSVVPAWPKPGDVHGANYQETLGPILAPGFDAVDLENRLTEVLDIVAVESAVDRVTIQFHDSDGCLQRAVFARAGGDRWALRSLKFQCPACLGAGMNNGHRCAMCGGSGWGVE
jgi:hypothetical protein